MAVVIAVVVGELQSAGWATRRQAIVGTAILTMNAAVLFWLAALCVLAVSAAPSLMRHA